MAFIIILEITALLFFILFLSIILFYRKKLIWIFVSGNLFFVTTAVLVYVILVVFSTYGVGLKSENPRIVKIKRGSTLSEIGWVLFYNDIIDNQKEFIWISKLFRFEKELKAGKYEIPERISYYSLLLMLHSGKSVQENVTIAEGLRTEKIASILSKKIGIDKDKFLSLLSDQSFIESLGLETSSLDGFLLPETYNFYWGMSEQELITAFIKEFKKILTDSVMAKISESEFKLRDYVILASIIEGEAVHDEERCNISAVFHNRLKLNIRLQADPTIQYIINDGPRRLLKKDLKIESPYNTYLHSGLPPGPICNPGKKSILSAIYPADEDYIYFVATGDGYHTFSRNKREHLLAKRKLDRLRREFRKSQKLNE